MRNEIITKLAKFLDANSIDDEAKVVYVLVQVRKVLEHEKAGPALKFYCNWALHIELTHRDAQAFLSDIQPRFSWRMRDQQLIQYADRLLTLNQFRANLQSFLVTHQLSQTLCLDNHQWNEFQRAYAKVVENCPLRVASNPQRSRTSKKGSIKPITTDIAIRIEGRKPELMVVVLDSLWIRALPNQGNLSGELPLPMEWRVNYRIMNIENTKPLASGSLTLGQKGMRTKTFSM